MTQPFDAWMTEVNEILERKCSLVADDLANYCYQDAYDDGLTAVETAALALRAARNR